MRDANKAKSARAFKAGICTTRMPSENSGKKKPKAPGYGHIRAFRRMTERCHGLELRAAVFWARLEQSGETERAIAAESLAPTVFIAQIS